VAATLGIYRLDGRGKTMSRTLSNAGPIAASERKTLDMGLAKVGASQTRRGADLMSDVAGVVLAGTQPWGGCDLEWVVPRALVPVANKPLIGHVLEWLAAAGVKSVDVCGNRYTDLVRRRLLTKSDTGRLTCGLTVHYYEDMSPRGPAGCVRDAGALSDARTLVVVDGSLIPQVELQSIVETHRQTGAALTVVVSRDARGNGVNGDGLSPMGIYVFERSVIGHIPSNGYQDIKEALIPLLYRRGMCVMPYLASGSTPRVTNVDSYLAVNAWVLRTLWNRSRGLGSYGGDGYRSVGDAGVHRSVAIDSTVRLSGPILIGEETRVGQGVTIVGPASIGRGCHLGDGSVICRSVVWEGCTIGSHAVLDRCILTTRSNVRPDGTFRYVIFSEAPPRFRNLRRLFGVEHSGDGSPIGAMATR